MLEMSFYIYILKRKKWILAPVYFILKKTIPQ